MKTLGLEVFLKKFRTLGLPDIEIRKAFVESTKETLNINIDVCDVSFNKKQKTIHLKTFGRNKSVFFIKKEKLIEKVNNKLKKEGMVKRLFLS